jgi:unsaturated chondroitin disaccharide hydrolase
LKNSYQNIVQGTLEEIFQNYLSIGGILLHGSWGRVRKSWNIGGFPQQDIMPYGNNWVVEVLYRLLNSDWKIYKTI